MKAIRNGSLTQAPALWLVFAAIFVIRMIVALTRQEMIWPDEHFQTLEPAYGAVHGVWLKAWEWNEGFRSWIPPSVFIPLFFVMKLFGVTGGVALVMAARVFSAILSMLVPYGLDRLAVLAGWSRVARLLMLTAFLANSAMAMWAPAPLTDSLGTALLWGLFPIAWLALTNGRGFLAGMLMAAPFLIRMHLGLYALFFGLMILLLPRFRAQTLTVLAGGLSVGALFGVVDWITWGKPFHSLTQQLTVGIERSEFYGVDPWHSYLSRLVDDQGFFWVGTSLIVFLAGVSQRWRTGRMSQNRFESPIVWITLGSVLFFLVHMAIPHKETRFIQPVFPVFFLAFGFGVESFSAWLQRMDWNRLTPGLVTLAFWIALFGVMNRDLYLGPTDLTRIFSRILDEEKSDPEANGCILLIDYNWSWSRGALGIGRAYTGEDKPLHELTPGDLQRCPWVVLKEEHLQSVQDRAQGREFAKVMAQSNGYQLWRSGP